MHLNILSMFHKLKLFSKKGLQFPDDHAIIDKQLRVKQKLQNTWGRSSPGRALEWHSRGSRFDPDRLHQEKAPEGRGCAGSGAFLFCVEKWKNALKMRKSRFIAYAKIRGCP